jgi:hypothetical protein
MWHQTNSQALSSRTPLSLSQRTACQRVILPSDIATFNISA